MSGGRWVKQKNGDYQHYTDEELADQARAKVGLIFGLCLIGGPVLMFYFNEMIFGGIISCVGIIGIFIRPAETLGTVVGAAILIAIFWSLSKCEGDEKEEKKETKTEVVSEPPKTQNVYV